VNGPPSVAIVGGGILGMTAAYRLAQKGVRVALYERSPDLGGLVGSFDFDGYPVDRFYHVVLPTDDRVRGLAEELGLGDRFRFRPTKVGFYGDGRLFSMTSPKELLTFPLLRLRDRLRLGAFVARCQLTKTHDELDETPLLEWLRRRSGKNVLERMWAPLLDSKFDGHYDDLPATYIWARTRRMSKTRDKSGRSISSSARSPRRWPAACWRRSSSRWRRPTTAATSASSACCCGRGKASARTTT
jgi:protoporphyrinogen oxidase